nr:DUF4372 domain-containing protein [uncultured Prevotella sp.]
MNVGRYVFSQVVKYIPRYQFDECVKKYRGDWACQRFDLLQPASAPFVWTADEL